MGHKHHDFERSTRGGGCIPANDALYLDRELASEAERNAMRYDALLDCFGAYADDVYEHHGPAPHYQNVATFGDA